MRVQRWFPLCSLFLETTLAGGLLLLRIQRSASAVLLLQEATVETLSSRLLVCIWKICYSVFGANVTNHEWDSMQGELHTVAGLRLQVQLTTAVQHDSTLPQSTP